MENKTIGCEISNAPKNKKESARQGLAPAVKKIASLLLAVAMLFTITAGIDLSAYAATIGKCGKDATWSYDADTSILTISGKGATYNYEGENSAPWEKSFDDEYGNVKVNIESGITSIGSYNFTSYYYDLKNFKIPNSVQTIEYNAFCHLFDYYVYEDFWENGLVYISNCLVDTNQDLPSNLVIKEGTRVIKKNIFNCCGFTSVKIPKSLSCIPEDCFSHCENLSSITFDGKVKTIGNSAFYNTGFTKFVIPDGVIQIGDYAFSFCELLTNLTIPKTVRNIGVGFIQASDVKNIYYKGTKSDWNKITIGKDNGELKTVKISYASPTTGLKKPTLKATVNANGSFKLTWNKVSGAEKYELYIKQSDGSYKLMKTTTGTSFTTGTAVYGKQYTYKVRAFTSKNSSATSAYSAAVNAKNTKKLQTPKLKATVNKNGSFKLSWGKVTGATSYQIYMKQANGKYKLIKKTTASSFKTAVAKKGKTYSYKVRAITSKNSKAASNYSNIVSAKRK